MNKVVPELAIMSARSILESGQDLVDEETQTFLKSIPESSTVVELGGGLGEVSEFLSKLVNTTVRLVEERRLFFVYRRQIFPNSKVIELNTLPHNIKAGESPYWTHAIIHGPQYKELAMKVADSVYDVSTKEIYGKKPVDNNEKPLAESKDQRAKQVNNELADLPNDISPVENKDDSGNPGPGTTSN